MFKYLKIELDHFYDLAEARQESLLAEINEKAAKDKVAFKAFLSNVAYGYETNRAVFYEAIWVKPKGWDDFVYDELAELVSLAESGREDAIEEVDSIAYLTQLEEMSDEFYQKTLRLLVDKLASPIAALRENCAKCIKDLNEIAKLEYTKEQIEALQKLLMDIETDVRIAAYHNLENINSLPQNFELSSADKQSIKLLEED